MGAAPTSLLVLLGLGLGAVVFCLILLGLGQYLAEKHSAREE